MYDPPMTFWQFFGLIMSLTSLIITIMVLIYDALRKWYWKIPTISRLIWNDLAKWRKGEGPFPWLSLLLPAGMALIPIGMLIHFFAH